MTQYKDKLQAMAHSTAINLKKKRLNIESWKWPEYVLHLGSVFLIFLH